MASSYPAGVTYTGNNPEIAAYWQQEAEKARRDGQSNYYVPEETDKTPAFAAAQGTGNLWEGERSTPVNDSGQRLDPNDFRNYFNSPRPAGVEGFTAGANYGQNEVAKIYGSQDAKDIWAKLKNESAQGLDASSLKSLKDKYGSQGVTDQARIQKSGMKGMAALRAGEDVAGARRQEAAAMDAAIKKQAFNSMRDEWGRRTLLSTNLPMAYGQLGSAAVLGQTMQNLAGQSLNYQQYMS